MSDRIKFQPDSLPQMVKALSSSVRSLDEIATRIAGIESGVDARGWNATAGQARTELGEARQQVLSVAGALGGLQSQVEKRLPFAEKLLGGSTVVPTPNYGYNGSTPHPGHQVGAPKHPPHQKTNPPVKPRAPRPRDTYWGSTGNDVKALQKELNAAGVRPPLKVDGIFGPATYQAVKAFQGRMGLEVDGIVGPKTRRALGQAPGGGRLAGATAGPVAGPQDPGEIGTGGTGCVPPNKPKPTSPPKPAQSRPSHPTNKPKPTLPPKPAQSKPIHTIDAMQGQIEKVDNIADAWTALLEIGRNKANLAIPTVDSLLKLMGTGKEARDIDSIMKGWSAASTYGEKVAQIEKMDRLGISLAVLTAIGDVAKDVVNYYRGPKGEKGDGTYLAASVAVDITLDVVSYVGAKALGAYVGGIAAGLVTVGTEGIGVVVAPLVEAGVSIGASYLIQKAIDGVVRDPLVKWIDDGIQGTVDKVKAGLHAAHLVANAAGDLVDSSGHVIGKAGHYTIDAAGHVYDNAGRLLHDAEHTISGAAGYVAHHFNPLHIL